jgi:hypothetical protein
MIDTWQRYYSNRALLFYSVIPIRMLQTFTQKELDLIICGVPDINVDDLQWHCKINSPYSSKHKSIVVLFSLFRRWDKQAMVHFFLFTIGNSHVPVGGFAVMAQRHKPITIEYAKYCGHLPLSQWCFNRIDLPDYPDERTLEEKLTCYIQLLLYHKSPLCNGFNKWILKCQS